MTMWMRCVQRRGLEDPSTLCSDSEYEALSSNELHDPRITVAIPMAGTDRKAFFGAMAIRMFMHQYCSFLELKMVKSEIKHILMMSQVSIFGGCH